MPRWKPQAFLREIEFQASRAKRGARAVARDYTTFMHSVYILKCADTSLYVGCTNNLKKRLQQHNKSKYGAHYTKIRRPVKLLYSKNFKTLFEARHREAEIKTWNRKKKLALVKK